MTLNPKQQEAVDHENGPLLIIAGAGSGKTKTLTARLAALLKRGIAPEAILAITFTNKAAREMIERLSHIPRKKVYTAFGEAPFIGTFHSFGARLLREEARALNRTKGFTIFDTDDSLKAMRTVMRGETWARGEWSPARALEEMNKVKNLLLNPRESLDERSLEAYERYETFLQENNAFDFNDLIQKPVQLFRNHPDISKKYEERFTHILVDEYQDVNTAQYELVKHLAKGHGNLCVVGDDAQAIYGWRYADFKNFLNFPQDWEKTCVVKLEQNYRSTAHIITAASEVIKNNVVQNPKTLWTTNDQGELIQVIGASEPEEEAEHITEIIRKKLSEKAHDIAILYRTNAQSRALESALIQAQIPYRIFGGVRFYERREIKDIVSGLRVVANPKDTISQERLLTNLPKAIARPLLQALLVSESLPPLELIRSFLETANYFEYLAQKFPNAEERIQNIKELLSYASGFQNTAEFLEQVTLLQSTDDPTHENEESHKVNLMTIHMAKGLEFDHVILSGTSEGLLPHQMSYGTKEGLEEERRLMYVAMTRAKKTLAITFTKLPSRFLYEIPPELTEFKHLHGTSRELPDEDIIYYD